MEELGLFPLGLVLNPGALLPLHIFEMRYRQLLNKAWEGEKRVSSAAEMALKVPPRVLCVFTNSSYRCLGQFGVVMYNSKQNAWAKYGTVAEISNFQPLADGRIVILSEGKERFRVLKVTRPGGADVYIRALVEYIDDLDDDTEASLSCEAQVWDSLQKVLQTSNQLYGKSLDLKVSVKDLAPGGAGGADTLTGASVGSSLGTSSSGEASLEESSSGASAFEKSSGQVRDDDTNRRRKFSFAVAQVLDLSMEDQQRMLQTQSTEQRFQRQLALLQQAERYLTAQIALKNAFVETDDS